MVGAPFIQKPFVHIFDDTDIRTPGGLVGQYDFACLFGLTRHNDRLHVTAGQGPAGRMTGWRIAMRIEGGFFRDPNRIHRIEMSAYHAVTPRIRIRWSIALCRNPTHENGAVFRVVEAAETRGDRGFPCPVLPGEAMDFATRCPKADIVAGSGFAKAPGNILNSPEWRHIGAPMAPGASRPFAFLARGAMANRHFQIGRRFMVSTRFLPFGPEAVRKEPLPRHIVHKIAAHCTKKFRNLLQTSCTGDQVPGHLQVARPCQFAKDNSRRQIPGTSNSCSFKTLLIGGRVTTSSKFLAYEG